MIYKNFLMALFAGPFFLILTIVHPHPSHAGDLGTTGIIDIPTARMMQDGTLRATVSKQDSVSVYSLNYQATPWLEATFRYVGFEDFFYYDRSYEAKVRVLEEDGYFPQIAFGIRDLAGTGVFGSEYIVGSKKIGPVDVSLGIGWGRLAGEGDFENPFGNISDSFKTRNADVGEGGEFSFDNFFSGKDAGLFGGITYTLPNYPLKFMAEYNPDQYRFQVSNGNDPPKSPYSFGVELELFDDLYLSASYQHNNEFGLRISADLNTKQSSPKYPQKYYKSTLDMKEEEFPSGYNPSSWYDRLVLDMNKAGLYLISADYERDGQEITLQVGNEDYRSWPDALSVAIRLVDLHLPQNFKSVSIVINEEGFPIHTIETLRQQNLYNNSRETFVNHLDILLPRQNEKPFRRTDFVRWKIPVDIALQNRVQLMDPDEPFRYQIYAQLNSSIALPANFSINSSIAIDIENNFDTIIRESDSVLPRVRSEMKKYYQQGETGIERLHLTYVDSLQRSTFLRLEAGIVDEMFSAIGGEILFSKQQSRFATGASLHWAKKRDYDRRFDHLNYEAVTGFVSAYWATPLYNFDAALHVGQYLAEDKGATFELRRTFDNGWKVGVWATKTDVSAEEFGEGSFDKGLYFRVPLNALFGRDTRNYYHSRLRPIQRDGGARLEGFSGELWHSLRDVRYDLLDRNKSRMKP